MGRVGRSLVKRGSFARFEVVEEIEPTVRALLCWKAFGSGASGFRVVNGPDGPGRRGSPGQSYCNGDGVCVDNDEDSSGNATIDPKTGEEGDETTVDTDSGFEGDIDGIDSNDTVDLGSSNDVDITGTGGEVNVGGGSNVDITNTSGAGGTSITVNLPSGTKVTVGPGSTVNIKT